MNTLPAHHYRTGRPVRVHWEGATITTVEEVDDAPAGRWIAPALVDLQINGYAGVDFQQDDLTLADWQHATRRLCEDGCGRYLLTLVTDHWSRLMARLRALRTLRESSPMLHHAVAGWHIEGPFLSAEAGFRGAHDASCMLDPTREHLRELRHAAGDDPLLLTLAPERPGALEAIEEARVLDITVSLGHTNAPAERIVEAMHRGARAFTHLGNGCPRNLDRHDNILWRILEIHGLAVSLIPDQIHVSPALFRLIHRLLDPASIFHTTDAMAAAGAPPGKFRLGRLELEVAADQVVRLPGTPNFAGSALRPIDGVLRAARMLGCSWRQSWDHSALAPARLMGWSWGLTPGAPAECCALEFEPSGALQSLHREGAGATIQIHDDRQ